MATTTPIAVKDLHLDLSNFRTVKQKNEVNAVNAMISISPDKFWALMESLLDDGYLPTENVIVLKDKNQALIVKEGNRRVACLKIILGYLDRSQFSIPSALMDKISAITSDWTKTNEKIPCSVYELKDAKVVDRIVALTHGKGEKAGRDRWESVARARHNREMSGSSEPALDLLEKYLVHGRNLTGQQTERWAGDYPLSVLDEAIMRLLPRIGVSSAKDLIRNYPTDTRHRALLEELMRQIGANIITFTLLRDANEDVLESIGFPSLKKLLGSGQATGGSGAATGTKASKAKATPKNTKTSKGSSTHPFSDSRTVKSYLKNFNPKGTNRQKIATLREEALSLNLTNNPIAFCFILRSMFEISAKAYCADNGISLKKSKIKAGQTRSFDKTLLEILKDVTNHLTKNKTDKQRTQLLHGAITELAKSEGLLSVTSMNQLVHNPSFSVTSNDICTLFGQVYPLLEFMNS